ncbi:MAG: hypothetical protein NVSMB22_05470 [Chloroflexota bacterium]
MNERTVAEGNAIKPVVFLDVDNTLLDNDRLKKHVAQGIEGLIGANYARRFWELYEDVRQERDYVDYPTTIDRLSMEVPEAEVRTLLTDFLFGLPFPDFLFPGALETIHHLKSFGAPAVLSDGDHIFQPWKIKQSGIEAAVEGRVLICVHKERELPQVFARLPAQHYVMIDDKTGILSALERECPTEFTTVLVQQGHYAAEPQHFDPAPDYVVARIADVQALSPEQLGARSARSS